MIPKVVGLIMIIMAAISLIALVACLSKGLFHDTTDYDDCEV